MAERSNNFHFKTIHLWIIVFGIILSAYYFINPIEASWMPQCVFHKVTGLQCMGCGAQRMIHSLLHGDFKGAFQANAFLLLSLPFLGFLVFVELNRLRMPILYKKIHSLTFIITVSAMLLTWLILRNIFDL